MRAGWRRCFADFVIRGWRINISHGPDFQWWAQWDQMDGGACAVGWITLGWHTCVCERSDSSTVWCYCSFHRKYINGMKEPTGNKIIWRKADAS